MDHISFLPKPKPNAPTAVVFRFTTERPSLHARTGHAYQRIREILHGLSPANRAVVLLNLCTSEIDEQRGGTGGG